ncbi:YjgN family protein [Agrobacterium sp. Azo12]|jgi:uncharacterized membrane protein YjgN (DUF898 family)|uniref:YjgN family protein n=1 Tax=Agrobacterium sp. Azo12 TaxID=3031129 RepID=UPI0023D80EA5|nr:YjgN family protein [Agrobacterium sp. Azo12]MDO5894391.1 YjgN family protein [Agrobacterium sp. Azo12]
MNEAFVPVGRQAAFERGSFTGSAKEYFGIWIVNILLTIVTIGIYSAWAKVRRKRYFNGNTVLHGRAFGYHATGGQIFKGRLIAFGFIIVMNVLAYLIPPAALISPIVIFIFLPWLIMRSIRFNARVTSYRNVRFDFVGTAGGAFVSILLGSMVAFLSFGILAPFSSRWATNYIFGNLRYGDRPFTADPKIGKLYKAWIIPAVMVVVGGSVFGVLVTMLFMAVYSGTDAPPAAGILGAIYFAMFGAFIIYGFAGIIYRVGVRNVVVSSMLLDGKHQLQSDLGRGRYLWIVISNLVVSVLSLGLMRPWAAVREARYSVEHTAIRFDGDVGEVLSSIEATGAAVSAEYMDMEGFEFGF